MSFNLENVEFIDCNVQMNEGSGVQNNPKYEGLKYDDVELICSELETIALENEDVRNSIKEIKLEIERGTSKKKMVSLLEMLKNTITVASIVTKFPDIIEKVKPMIERLI